MLRDGKFIKEPPPKIGRQWTRVEKPHMTHEITEEELFMEAINLGYDPTNAPAWKVLLARLLRI